jgi:hypothetical protein
MTSGRAANVDLLRVDGAFVFDLTNGPTTPGLAGSYSHVYAVRVDVSEGTLKALFEPGRRVLELSYDDLIVALSLRLPKVSPASGPLLLAAAVRLEGLGAVPNLTPNKSATFRGCMRATTTRQPSTTCSTLSARVGYVFQDEAFATRVNE